ncbi:MAG: glycosyltransferase family 2 protein [Candidatus Doudnabacteria bacterium]|nr:glycosyltransferase family 2 protein [Candidatus Doudnabacteria bacterium]
MKLSILIVNWNTRDLLIKCINSILNNAPSFDYEIIVVDNNSKDGSVETLTNLLGHNKKIRLLQSLRNLGFARANNYAFQNSIGEYIFALNPDTEVHPCAIDLLVSYMEAHPAVGVAGPKLLNPDGTVQQSVRRFPTIPSSVLVFSGLYRIFRPRRYLMDDFDYNHEADVDQVMGAALLTRRSIIEKLGLFDENFWLWYEEVDFCKRVKDAGYQVKFYPGAQVMHRGAESFSQLAVFERKRVAGRSLVYYFKKNGNIFQVLAIAVVIPAVLFAAWFLGRLERAFKFKLHPHA